MGMIETYQNQGFSFFPLRKRSKKPLFDWAVWQTRRPNPDEIRTWQEQKLLNQVAIICGAISGIVVLDIDDRQKFDAWILEKKLPMPPSPTVRTGKGFHVYFKHPGGKIKNSAKKIPGADLKADGGYVVAPPSIHPNGQAYEWVEFLSLKDADLADPPAWLRETFEYEHGHTVEVSDTDLLPPEDDWVSRALQGVSKGERNEVTTKLAGYYLGRGEPEGRVLELLRAWNLRNVEPLPDKELRATVASVGRREARRRVRESVGQAVAGKTSDLPWDEQREARLQGLGDLLGLPITDIRSTKTDNSVWEIVLGDEGSVVIDAAQLTSQAAFRTRFCQVAHLLPTKLTQKKDEPSRWDSVVREVMTLAQHLDASADATALGEVQDLIINYLLEYRGVEFIPRNKAIPIGAPFFILHREGGPKLYTRLGGLAVQARFGGYSLNRRRLAALMPSLGHESEIFKWAGHTVRAWRVNLEGLPEEIKANVYKKDIEENEESYGVTAGYV